MAKRRQALKKKNKTSGPVEHGLVIEMLGLEAIVRPDNAPEERLRALMRKKIARKPGVVVGDRVEYGRLEEADVNAPHAIITRVLTRNNVLMRQGFRKPQAVAANLDYVVIVVTPNDPPLRLGLIDRYLVACAIAGVTPMLCLNKSDLDPEGEAMEELEIYSDLGIKVIETRVKPEPDVSALIDALKDKRAVLVGHSGVGKSSLANAIIPGLKRPVGAINETIGKGRHTTTISTLLPLPFGGELVDTPGIRSFGICGIDAKQLSLYLPEFQEPAVHCHFRSCTHRHEPKCMVMHCVEEGLIDEGRWERYAILYASLELGLDGSQ